MFFSIKLVKVKKIWLAQIKLSGTEELVVVGMGEP
jgi:hypothetical protein